MLRVASNTDAEGRSLSPLAYDFKEAKLILRDKTEIDITDVITKIKITESIQRVATLVNISILDTFDYIDLFKLDGTEKIFFRITREEPFPDFGNEFKVLERTVTIASIVDYKKPRPGALAYTLSCVPDYAYLNQFKTISKRVSGSVRKNIFTICSKDLKIKEDFIGFNGRGSTNCNAIIPLMKPLTAINWLLRNSDDGGTPYYFYQTMNGIIRCKSKKEMQKENVYETYNNKPFFESIRPSIDDPIERKVRYYDEIKKKISLDRSEIKLSKYVSGAEGAYGSTTHHLDISTKTYKAEDYNFKQTNLLNEKSPLGEDSKIAGQDIKELTTGKNNFYNENRLAFTKKFFGGVPTGGQNYHNNASSTAVATMNSHKALHDITSQRFEIPGDFDLEAGSIINLDLLRVAEVEENSGVSDKSEFLSGKHIVTTIEHIFTPDNYKMVVSAKKDSFIASLDERKIAKPLEKPNET